MFPKLRFPILRAFDSFLFFFLIALWVSEGRKDGGSQSRVSPFLLCNCLHPKHIRVRAWLSELRLFEYFLCGKASNLKIPKKKKSQLIDFYIPLCFVCCRNSQGEGENGRMIAPYPRVFLNLQGRRFMKLANSTNHFCGFLFKSINMFTCVLRNLQKDVQETVRGYLWEMQI